LGIPALLRLHPRRVGIPHVAIALNEVNGKLREKTSEKKGVKGALPLGCFPLWGREGVTLVIVRKIFVNC